LKTLIKAYCKGEALQKQIHDSKKNGTPDGFDIWWLGQSGFLIQWNKICVLLDPYLSDSLTKKYANTGKPHTRMSELVIDPSLLNCINIVTSSHNHTDHLDADTLIPLLKINPGIKFIIPEANRSFVADRLHCDFNFPAGLNDGEKTEHQGISFYGIPAAHNDLERDEYGNCKFMGYILKFGRWSVYHSGDTLWFDSIVDMLKPFHLDVAFLPINGNDPSRGVAGNLSAEEAVRLGKEVGARLVIPHHYHMFEFNTADPENFAAHAKKKNQAYHILRLGEKWSSTELSST
jgi:L-ascorbate metabolism protein UlaG (beta-lactamase superfamily)